MRKTAIIALSAASAACVWLLVRERQQGPAPRPVIQVIDRTDQHPLPDVLMDPAIFIEKSLRRLTVISDGAPVKHYRVALGSQPADNKEREGDGRTPEGTFYVCTRGETSRYARALGLSYPAEADADRGLARGLISRREHRSITDAIRRMQRPPWNTALGGEIMVHGGGNEGDWTAGCIALSDEDAAELFDAVPLGAPVEIVP